MKNDYLPIRRNIPLFMLHYFFRGVSPCLVIGILFFEAVTGSYFSALSVFAIVFISIFLFEIPFGVFSDQYLGRRRTMICGAVMWVLSAFAFAFGGEVGQYWLLVLGAVFMGASDAFFSGTEEGLFFETLTELRQRRKFHEIFGRCRSVEQIGLVFGAIIGFGTAYLYSLTVAMWLSFGLSFGLLIVDLFMVEPRYTNLTRTNLIQHVKASLALIKLNPMVSRIMFARFLNHSAGEVFYRFEIAFFSTLIPLWGIMFARLERQIFGVFSFWQAGPLLTKLGFRRLLPASVLGDVLSRGFGLAVNSVLTPFILPLSNLFYGVEMVAADTLLQREFSNAQRATMASLISLGVNFSKAVLYIVIGFIAESWGPLVAMFCIVAVKASSVPIYYSVSKLIKEE